MTLFRIIRMALQQIGRNLWLSVVTVVIVLLAVVAMHVLVATMALGEATGSLLREKIDITLDLSPTVSSEQILALRTRVEAIPEVARVEILSPQQVYERFKERFRSNDAVKEALTVVGRNPFGPTMAVQVRSLSQYDRVVGALESPEIAGDNLIQYRSFDDRRQAIRRFALIEERARWGAIGLVALFVLLNLYVVYNTIRLTIYSHREEIGIMKLVGASNSFIRFPFILESVLLSLIALGLGYAILYAALPSVDPMVARLFAPHPVSLAAYYQQYWQWIVGGQIGIIALVNMASSALAVGRYLKV